MGFAVVAEEVKSLASRSANAAKETAEIIEGSIEQVKAGNDMATETNEAFKEIVDKIKKYRIRRFVKPGITGWAAIHSFRGGTENMGLMQKRVDYDLDYIGNWTLWKDIKISAITFWQMLTLNTGAI